MCKKDAMFKFKNKVFELVGNEYEVISDNYVNNKTKVLIKHKICNNEYLVRPNDFLSRNRRCPKCSMKSRILHLKENNQPATKFKDLVEKLTKSEYSLLGKYINNKTKVLVRHNICEKEYLVRPNDFQQGYRCPFCAEKSLESKGVKFIKKYLEENNVEYITEFRLNNNDKIRFDFMLPKHSIIIEFDGSQHFKVNKSSKYLDSYKRTIKNDWKKNLVLLNSKFSLLRINYKFNLLELEELLNSLLFENTFYLDSKCYFSENGKIHNLNEYYKKGYSLYFNKYSFILKDVRAVIKPS